MVKSVMVDPNNIPAEERFSSFALSDKASTFVISVEVG
jgi:hypothetical protein